MKNIGIIIFNILLLISCISVEEMSSNVGNCPQLTLSTENIASSYPLDYIYIIPDDDEKESYKLPINIYKDHKYIDLCFYAEEDDDDVYTYIDGKKVELDDCIFSTSPNRYIDSDNKEPGDIFFTSNELDFDYDDGKFYINDDEIKSKMKIDLNRNTFKLNSNILITNFKTKSLSEKEIESLKNISVECYILSSTSKYDIYNNKILNNSGTQFLYNISNLYNYRHEIYNGLGHLDSSHYLFPINYKSKLLFKFSTIWGKSTLEIPINMKIKNNDNIELITIVDINDLMKYSRNIKKYIKNFYFEINILH